MSTIHARVLVLVPFLLVVWVAAAATCPSYEELELSWDDGSAEGGFAMLDGARLVVGFYAPDTALTVTGMRFYLIDDGIPDPPPPDWPSTAPFTVWLFTSGPEGQPAIPVGGYLPDSWDGPCPEDCWVDIVFAEPVDISDETYYPEHKFHVGLEFEYREGPVVGLDLDPPISGETRYWDWSTWVAVDTANAIVRAVVCDSSGVPVQLESWGRVKSEYR